MRRMNAITKAIEIVGGAARLADRLGVSTQSVCFWRDGERRFPARLAPAVERITGGQVTCEMLCPDVEWDVVRRNGQPAPSMTAEAA